jgi:hypothetical protein
MQAGMAHEGIADLRAAAEAGSAYAQSGVICAAKNFD